MVTESKDYDFHEIERRWQSFWEQNRSFEAGADPSRPKYYVLDIFPYPSGSGLHIGHPEGYTATDIIARHRRARGFSVLHPMGWDAFGLPAEQHAVKTGTHPAANTQNNIANFKRQPRRARPRFSASRLGRLPRRRPRTIGDLLRASRARS